MALHELPSQVGIVEHPPFPHGKRLEMTRAFVNGWLNTHPGQKPNLRTLSSELGLKPQSFRRRLQRIRKEDPTFLPRELKPKPEKTPQLRMVRETVPETPPKIERPQKTYGLEDATPNIVQRHKDIFGTLTEAIREAGLRCKPAKVYPFLVEAGIRLKKVDEENHSPSRGKYTKFSRFFILREDLPQIIEKLKSLKEKLKLRKMAIKYEERVGRVKTFIRDWINTGQKISLSVTAIAKELRMDKQTVRKVLKDIALSDPDFPVPKKTHPQKVENTNIDNVTVNIARGHPDLYSSLGNLILDANAYISSSQTAKLIKSMGLKVREITEGNSRRFFVSTQDRAKIIELLRAHTLSSIENVSRYMARTHPELYSSLASIIRESRIHAKSREVAELLKVIGIQVSLDGYFVFNRDRNRIIVFLQGLGKELLS